VPILRERLLGADPRNIVGALELMRFGKAAGHVVNAIAGVEIALWDLLGKFAGLPVHQLLGGSRRDAVEFYADCHAGKSVTSLSSYDGEYVDYTPQAYAANGVRAESKGFSMVKFDFYPDFPGPDNRPISTPLRKAEIDHCVTIARTIREALDPSTGLAFDMGGGYTAADAIRLAAALEPVGVEWIEDPVRSGAVPGLAAVTRSTSIPVLCSYTQPRNTREHALNVVREGAARMIAIDFGNIGGLKEGVLIAEIAGTSGISLATHNIATPVGTVAAAQASSTVSEFVALEHHAVEVDWWDAIVSGPSVVSDGRYLLNDKPGLGVELDFDTISNHAEDTEGFLGLSHCVQPSSSLSIRRAAFITGAAYCSNRSGRARNAGS
jgi:L-alanine-DL-glutamate epimerase-like enolase superfamily enzyme